MKHSFISLIRCTILSESEFTEFKNWQNQLSESELSEFKNWHNQLSESELPEFKNWQNKSTNHNNINKLF